MIKVKLCESTKDFQRKKLDSENSHFDEDPC